MEEEFRRGDVIVSRYELHQVVGSGAGGRIFLAFDRNLGGRETAIKFYEPDTLIADLAQHVRKGTISRDIYESELSNIYARFRQEAIRISRLDHPSIVKVFDYRDTEYQVEAGGRRVLRNKPFLAMEFVRGATLEERLSRDKLPLREALEIGAQVADGLAYAHHQNLVHRDLKPSNIMVEQTPIGLRVRIIDWGVAKVVAREVELNITRIISTSEALGDEIHTRGILLGTPKFIAPEHFGSEGAQWSPASDVFALGMLMFRLVTGRPVRRESYVGECLTQTDREVLLRACAHVPELAHVVQTSLSEQREERLEASEVRNALRGIQERLTGTEATPGAPGTFPTPPTRVASPLDRAAEGDVSAMTAASVPDPDEDDYELPARRGPGWLAVLVALAIGVGGGVAAAAFLLPPAAETARDGASATAPEREPVAGEPADVAALPSTVRTSDEGATPPPPVDEPEPDPDLVDVEIRIDAVPPSKVSARGPDGYVEIGSTPLTLKLSHRYEARALRFDPLEGEDIFTPGQEIVHAWDYLDEGATREVLVKLACASVFDPKCNDYQKKFDAAFDKEAGQ